jgi:hypothetical protein
MKESLMSEVTLKVGDMVRLVAVLYDNDDLPVGSVGEVVFVDNTKVPICARFDGWTGGHSGMPFYTGASSELDAGPTIESSANWNFCIVYKNNFTNGTNR